MSVSEEEGGGALLLARSLKVGEKRWLCFISFSESLLYWRISISDALGVWSTNFDKTELCEIVGEELQETFLKDLNSTLASGDLEISRCSADSFTLSIKTAVKPLQFKLLKLTDPEILSGLTFDLCDQLVTVQQQLEVCCRKLEDAKLEKAEKHELVVVDTSYSTGGTKSGRAKRPVGGSLVNPGTKRRKAVKGVVFGESSQDH